jgi:hypothetical protein
VHILIRRHPLAALPADDVGRAQWIENPFSEKEKTLQKFYNNDHSFASDSTISAGKGARDQVGRLGTSSEQNEGFGNDKYEYAFTVFFWAITLPCLFGVMWYSPLSRWILLAITLIQPLVTKFGGFDELEVQITGSRQKLGKNE